MKTRSRLSDFLQRHEDRHDSLLHEPPPVLITVPPLLHRHHGPVEPLVLALGAAVETLEDEAKCYQQRQGRGEDERA